MEDKILTSLTYLKGFKEDVRELLTHIENTVDDENWGRIKASVWNKVSQQL